jgi:hypothetical protein
MYFTAGTKKEARIKLINDQNANKYAVSRNEREKGRYSFMKDSSKHIFMFC